MSLFRKMASVLSFGTIQIVASKFISFVNFAILVRLLQTSEIGIIGLVGGYIALVSFLFVTPESILIRDFKKMQPRLNEYVSSFLQFLVVRNAGLFLLAVPLAWYLIPTLQGADPRVTGYFLLVLAYTLISSFSGPFREAFYGYYRQARITFVDLAVNGALFASMGVLYFSRDVLTYGWLQVAVSLIGLAWWYWNARTHLHFSFVRKWNLDLAVRSIKGFGIWNHLSGAVIRLVYQVDIVVLSFFVGLETLGIYSVALTIANVFSVFPQMFQKVLSLSLSQLDHATSIRSTLGVALRYNFLFSLAQWIGYVILGTFIISVFGPEQPESVWWYGLYIVGGITLFNMVRPWTSLALARMDPREFFLGLFLVPSLLAVPIYFWAASQYGAMGVAQANVLAFGLMAGWVVVYTRIRTGVSPQLFQLTTREKSALQKVWNAIFRKKGSP